MSWKVSVSSPWLTDVWQFPFDGIIDEVRIYNEVLSDSEVLELYSVGLCGNGTLDTGEECDDGNVVDGDGCNSDCRTTE